MTASDKESEMIFRMLLAALLIGGKEAYGEARLRVPIDEILGPPKVEVGT
jgi:hypothetical protein